MHEVHARFEFHGDLNYFLSPQQRGVSFEHSAGVTDTLKHVIESVGVPHPEVARVTVDGCDRDLGTALNDGEKVDVFPYLTPIPLHQPCFVLDGHLGRLAAYLRMLGFDTWYDRSADDPLLASISSTEQRVLLTRDVGLLKRREVIQGYCVRNDKPHEQLKEVTARYDLEDAFAPFTRCMHCNGILTPVEKREIADLLPPHTRETKREFSRCVNCGKIFWRGSHHARMLGWIRALTGKTDCDS